MSPEEALNEKWNIRAIMEELKKTSHNESAPETRERLTALETSTKLFMEQNKKDFKEIKDSLLEFHSANKEAMQQLNDKLDKALETKAGVWVEKVMVWSFYFIGAGILGYLGALIIKLIEIK